MALAFLRPILSVAAICIGSVALGADVTIPTYRGTATVGQSPSKIVALDIAAVDTLDALKVPLAGVPANLYVSYLGNVAENAAPVGTLFEPDFEAIALMAPDLIVAGGRSSKQFEALSEIAPTVDMTIWGDDHVKTALARLHGYGMIMDKQAEAAALEQAFFAKLTEAKAAAQGKGNALIVLT